MKKKIFNIIFLLIIFININYFSMGASNVLNKNLAEKEYDENNIGLEILRLNKEGITPNFQDDIKEYYITVDESINDLQITAVPENKENKVEITGNTNLKNGMNTVIVKVISKNKKHTTEYKIYVTKTNDKQSANANLENLAIENYDLEPEFELQILNYRVEIEPETKELNILAIPQNQNAVVKVIGNNDLTQENNIITILVKAENGSTFKKYKITTYSKNDEQIKNDIDVNKNLLEQNKAEQLAYQIDNAKEIYSVENEEKQQNSINKLFIIFGIISFIAIIGIVGILIYKKHKKRY